MSTRAGYLKSMNPRTECLVSSSMAGHWETVQRPFDAVPTRLFAYDRIAFPTREDAASALRGAIEERGSFVYADKVTREPLFVCVPLEG